MEATWTTKLLVVLTPYHALAQQYEPAPARCIELNQAVVTQVANGQMARAETLLSKAIASGADSARDGCAEFVLNNMAALLSFSSRSAEVERLAVASVESLAIYRTNDLVQLRPHLTLAATGFEGGDKAWNDPTTLQRSVNYANASPGNYCFLVRIADPDASDRASVSSALSIIDPPMWLRWWFLSLLAATIISAGAALYRLRVGRLPELERIRTRIATDLHDDIGSNLSQIAILSEVALQNDSGGPNHDVLARIAEVSRETVHSISDIVWAVDPQHDRLTDLTNRMRRFGNDVFGARNIKLCFLSSGEREVWIPPDVRREIFLIFKECVTNAARHSGCDAVDVEFTVENSWLELRLADNGRGLDASAAPSGHGLTSMRRRIHGLGGEIEVTSREPGGVSVHLRVPLPPESYLFK